MSKVTRTKELIEEIRQIREQYQVEVGSKRKPWPKSIRERIYELRDLGLPMPELARRLSIPYQTIAAWQSKRPGPSFHALAIKAPTVTVGESEATVKSAVLSSDPTVTVRTPDNFTIEIPVSKVGLILRQLRLGK
jgi:DNA-binding transcriptional regulator YiaG